MIIGVLALQGSVREHCFMMESHGDRAVLVKTPEDLEGINGLILPGGESTTLTKLLSIKGLDKAIDQKILEGLPVWGTCAGLILLANKWLDIGVVRNGFGSQLSSFTSTIIFKDSPAKVSFIRAPKISFIGDGVDVLAKYKNEVVAVKKDNLLATTFHPEVTRDSVVYSYFTSNIKLSPI